MAQAMSKAADVEHHKFSGPKIASDARYFVGAFYDRDSHDARHLSVGFLF
jgi:hypothetical protein